MANEFKDQFGSFITVSVVGLSVMQCDHSGKGACAHSGPGMFKVNGLMLCRKHYNEYKGTEQPKGRQYTHPDKRTIGWKERTALAEQANRHRIISNTR